MKFLIRELKENCVKYVIELIMAIIIVLYTLYRIDQSYDRLDKKIELTSQKIDSIAADIRAITFGAAESSKEVFQDFKENRKTIYNKIYSDIKSKKD